MKTILMALIVGFSINANAGTYTPTLTNVAHAGGLSAQKAQYFKVTGVQHVSGSLTVASDSSTELTKVRISLPVATNLTEVNDCHGVIGEAESYNVGTIEADPATDSFVIKFLSSVSDAGFSYPLNVNYTVDCEIK